MHEILRQLSRESCILDLGSSSGSFDAAPYAFLVVGVDLEKPVSKPSGFVLAAAENLPFRNGIFDAVISNHSLEHFQRLDDALKEIGRVTKRNGALYAAVPDSSTISDILYRWLARGGGHVNQFSSLHRLREMVEDRTGFPYVGARLLHTSFSFLNNRNAVKPRPKRLFLLGGGNEYLLLLINYLFRIADRLLSTRWSHYGWALYFGSIPQGIDRQAWSNVCVRCGAGHPSQYLASLRRVSRRVLFFRFYSCPGCGAWNFFTQDAEKTR